MPGIFKTFGGMIVFTIIIAIMTGTPVTLDYIFMVSGLVAFTEVAAPLMQVIICNIRKVEYHGKEGSARRGSSRSGRN